MRWIRLVVALLCLWVIPAAAVQPDEILSDSQLEARARTLTKELRCMVVRSNVCRMDFGGQRALAMHIRRASVIGIHFRAQTAGLMRSVLRYSAWCGREDSKGRWPKPLSSQQNFRSRGRFV